MTEENGTVVIDIPVETLIKEVKVTKEASEFADSLVGLVKSGKKSLEDGFQAGSDIPVIISENLMGLMSGLEGMEKLGNEAEKERAAFFAAWAIAGLEIADIFMSKK